MWRHDAWARRVLNDKHPCRYCYKWGHWVANCPLYKAQKLPLGDPRLANPNFKRRKSAVCHPALLRAASRQPQAQAGAGKTPASVASVQQQVDKQDLALLDSGANDSVTNDISFP